MPELPEVETIRRRLALVLEGQTIVSAVIGDPRLTRPFDPALVAAELVGERFAELARRGKYLLLRLASGRTLVVHLRMTGSFRLATEPLPDDPYRRALLVLGTGVEVGYRDVRRFGTWELLEPGDEAGYVADRLGPEPLAGTFTARRLGERLAGSRAPLKSVLLDQRRVAGAGNIYVDEALWRSGLHPRRPAGGLNVDELDRLHRSLRAVLRRALALQGSTLRDYAAPDGEAGSMQDEFRVYGRAGEPCVRCRAPIERIVVGGRGTWFCPVCQPASRSASSPERSSAANSS
ncbi:MAG: bifunctional DNA-formamidopyrimidine glycosylase/DNA-(apurinic or apyrimidinic site) lyase [Thermoleophilia bacterium]|nr:bifunctional DNA-formamidopyrimidine glycosylase/DNA-(apurinic or apyrimidinic site) lyase [Thermoleophilia bacterium]